MSAGFGGLTFEKEITEMETLDEKIEEAYESWRSTWELDGMTIRDIYEAGYRHAIEDIEDETPNV